MRRILAFSVQLANRKLAIQRAVQLANRKLAIQMFAFTLLLLTGLNCGTENPVEETGDTLEAETSLTGTLRGDVQSIEGVLIQVRLLRDGQLVTQTETQASYELDAVTAGNYTLQISAKGHETTEIDVTVIAGQVVSPDKVTLVALGTPVSHLRGVLTNEVTGEPLGGINLQLTDDAGKAYETLTTAAGVFSFENLPVQQPFTLTIAHAGYEDKEVAVGPIPAAETLELTVELAPLQEPERLDPGQGLSLGTEAPDFELPDGNGKLHALADYNADKNVVLIFYRGGW
ncbi:carboxypeptidase regulatory-like domain-containing protein [Candidatus Poribacteria bacterium]|nr:carboxypeptidase regulatory-like domain-containing protein [Candidatus Poribacteria bacterium]